MNHERWANGFRSSLAVGMTLLAVSHGSSMPRLQGELNVCTPATATPDPSIACVKPITGCVCSTQQGAINAWQYGYCEGCHFVVSGVTDCGPFGSNTFTCDTILGCRSVSQCGGYCPCTGGSYFPFTLTCGSCDD